MDLMHEFSTKEWLVDALPFEVIWATETGQIAFGNAKFCKRLGIKISELSSLTIFDINSTVTQDSWKNHWAEIEKKKEKKFDAVHRDRHGNFYEVEVHAQFFSNNGKKYICSVLTDTSEQLFHQKLFESTEAMANLGGWKFNVQDKSILATDETMRILGITDKNQLLPGKVCKLFKNDKKLKSLFDKVLENGERFDEVFESKSERGKFTRVMGLPKKKGDKVFEIIGIYQDVSEQKKHEGELKLFKDIINNAVDLVYVYNRTGKLIHYSHSVQQMLGFSKEELDSFYIFNLDSNITPEWWEGHFKQVKELGSMHLEWLVTRKDGTKFPADIIANHVEFQGMDLNCAIIRDITERKIRNIELMEALNEIKSLKERLESENEYLQEEISRNLNADNIITESLQYQKIIDEAIKVAPTDTTVLISGESGTGKELLASAVHNNSFRKDRPLIKINCATLPKDLIESELFGHKKGAFTGAIEDKAGKFKLADGGTIFLDEIGELPLELQSRLLRVLQEGEFDELGGTETVEVNVRIIAATNRDLEEMVRKGEFREDLFYRLNVFPIHNIPLRARKEDISVLANFFLKKYSAKAGKTFKRLSQRTLRALEHYDFPGNIRELEHLIERAVIIEEGPTLMPGTWVPKNKGHLHVDEFKSFETAQRDYIIEVLNFTNWRVSGKNGAARILDMNDKTLFAKMKRLGIHKKISYD